MAEQFTDAQRLAVRLLQGNADVPNRMAKTDFGGRASMGARFMNALSKWPVNSSLGAFSDHLAGRETTVPKTSQGGPFSRHVDQLPAAPGPFTRRK